MHRRWLSFAFAAALPSLLACGKSGNAPPAIPQPHATDAAVLPPDPGNAADAPISAPTPVSATREDTRPRLVCFGDSLTAGYGTDPGESYPDALQRDLDQSGYKYRVINEGISGNTTKDGLARIDRVLTLHPALVVVEFGGNDGLRGVPIADSRRNLDAILSRLKSSGTPTALAGITLPPSYGGDYVRDFNGTYTLLAAKYKVPLLPFVLQGVYGTPGLMQEDNIHATAKGNEIVAGNVLKLVQPLLKK